MRRLVFVYVAFVVGLVVLFDRDVGLLRNVRAQVVQSGIAAGGGTVGLGTGGATGTVGGVLCKSAPGTTTTGTSEEILATCTIPANTISANGTVVEIEYTGLTAANANTKQIRVRLGGLAGVVIHNTTAVASNNEVFTFQFPIRATRLSATTVRAAGQSIRSAKGGATTAVGNLHIDDTETTDWTVAQALVVTATTPTAAGDFTLSTFLVGVSQ